MLRQGFGGCILLDFSDFRSLDDGACWIWLQVLLITSQTAISFIYSSSGGACPPSTHQISSPHIPDSQTLSSICTGFPSGMQLLSLVPFPHLQLEPPVTEHNSFLFVFQFKKTQPISLRSPELSLKNFQYSQPKDLKCFSFFPVMGRKLTPRWGWVPPPGRSNSLSPKYCTINRVETISLIALKHLG